MSDEKEKLEPIFLGISPQFAVSDLVKTAEYYRDVFGFTIRGYYLDPPVYAIVERGGVEIHLGNLEYGPVASNATKREGGLDAYIRVKNVYALAAELKARNADIIDGPELRDFGMHDMIVEDCDGHILAFGEWPDQENSSMEQAK